jgi:hypothetical protein
MRNRIQFRTLRLGRFFKQSLLYPGDRLDLYSGRDTDLSVLDVIVIIRPLRDTFLYCCNQISRDISRSAGLLPSGSSMAACSHFCFAPSALGPAWAVISLVAILIDSSIDLQFPSLDADWGFGREMSSPILEVCKRLIDDAVRVFR